MRSLPVLLCIAGLLASTAVSAGDPRKLIPTYTRTIEKVAAGGTLELDLRSGAGISIVGWNRDAVTVTLSLAGYEDRLAPRALARGARWDTTFIADRPGEDFAWLLDGKPAGQLTVTGSHLVEGHR